MLSCLRQQPPPPPPRLPTKNNHISSPVSQGYSADNTPTSSVQLSSTVNLSGEYSLAIKTYSYSEIRRVFDRNSSFDRYVDIEYFAEPPALEQILRPSHEHVVETLSLIQPNPLIELLTIYFEHSENISHLCLLLYQSVHQARLLYNPIHNFLDDLPHDFNSDSYSLSHSQLNLGFNIFLEFYRLENPFSPDSYNFNNIRQGFSELRDELNQRLKKSQSRVNLMRNCSTGSTLCMIATGVGVAISAIAIASHALIALVASPICPAILPSYMTQKEMVHLSQLDAAAKGAYFLHNDLDTINRLVDRLYTALENDKLTVHMVLERGVDRYPVQEVSKQFWRNRANILRQLADLEEHLFLCCAAINRARSLLLHEIHPHQNHHPG
ncbi:hypothetical protein F511_40541 [Dorcoceras hygrometricum]|uniref:Uncharacterized protein n=1 Tax=Dorcoceras hygrometricum TaxID=472368 RepID=A0A2Z7C925_9LAMI|nr:hypothetical protein F511_40541 [Dorcoceras hygrometricum]